MQSLFENWKCRASSGGKILTNEDKITQKQLDKLAELQEIKDTGLNKNGNKVGWIQSRKEEYQKLIEIRDKKDELPKGAKSYLDEVFDDVFWGRREIVSNDQMVKGTEMEVDGLRLVSDIDGFYYAENKKQFENDFITGEPDNFQINIKDIKSSKNKKTFDKAELTSLYKWQIRFYCWLCGKEDGEVIYVLVNSPYKQVDKAIYYLKEKHNVIDQPTPEFLKEAQQIERNHIFDIERWNKDYPNYQWYNTIFDFEIPKALRVKRFPVDFLPEHVSFIKKRVKMARTYLMQKEKAELEKIKSHSIDDYNKQIEIIKNKLKTIS